MSRAISCDFAAPGTGRSKPFGFPAPSNPRENGPVADTGMILSLFQKVMQRRPGTVPGLAGRPEAVSQGRHDPGMLTALNYATTIMEF